MNPTKRFKTIHAYDYDDYHLVPPRRVSSSIVRLGSHDAVLSPSVFLEGGAISDGSSGATTTSTNTTTSSDCESSVVNDSDYNGDAEESGEWVDILADNMTMLDDCIIPSDHHPAKDTRDGTTTCSGTETIGFHPISLTIDCYDHSSNNQLHHKKKNRVPFSIIEWEESDDISEAAFKHGYNDVFGETFRAEPITESIVGGRRVPPPTCSPLSTDDDESLLPNEHHQRHDYHCMPKSKSNSSLLTMVTNIASTSTQDVLLKLKENDQPG